MNKSIPSVRVDNIDKKGFNVKTDSFDKEIYNKLKEAEEIMNNNSKRYSLEEITESAKNNIQ